MLISSHHKLLEHGIGMSPYAPPSSQHNSLRGHLTRRGRPCLPCRHSRTECDGLQPVCSPCVQYYRSDPCEYSEAVRGRPQRRAPEDPTLRGEPRSRRHQNTIRDHNTTNYGDGSQTFNGSRVYHNRKFDKRSNSSAVVHVHVHGSSGSASSPSSSRSPSSSSSVLETPSSSQEIVPAPAPSATGAQPVRQLTRSERYTSLLLEYGLGHPLWKPIPRRTPEGEYIISIGDVGIISDGLPFNILFNITQPTDSLANRDGIPEGVDPPCILYPRWLTVVDKFHDEGTTFIRPEESISRQHVQKSNECSAYSFTLTDKHGALLMLPKGGTLRNLERTTTFHTRIQKHWRQWCGTMLNMGHCDVGTRCRRSL
ncbi:hypothetical protein L218DRAFT_67769 [Marasmius fiardii PR-910]|nr:hypothetical protein L218DRAFT_67769 [Marasmius fiardii PR-910]